MDIYWSVVECRSIPHINYEEPRPVLAEIAKTIPEFDNPRSKITNCPSFRESCKNTFSLHIPIDYQLTYANNDIETNMWDEGFFRDVVNVREPQYPNWTSMQFKYIFASEQDLEMEMLPCFMTSNGFTDNADIIPGKMNIGKWFRPLECAFVVKNGDRTVEFNRGDAFSFVRFNTDEKIKFRRFFFNNELNHITSSNVSAREYKLKLSPLSYFYNLYERSHMHSKIMREIKSNLMD